MVSPCGRRPRVEGPPTPSPHHRGACPATIQPWRPALVCVLLGAPRAVSSAGCTEALRGGYRAGALTLVSGAGAEAEGGAGPSTMMQRTSLLEETLMLGKIEGRRRRMKT